MHPWKKCLILFLMLASAGIMTTRIYDALTTLSVYDASYPLTKTDTTDILQSIDEAASVHFSEKNPTVAVWLNLKVILKDFFNKRFDLTTLTIIISLLLIHGMYLLIVVYQFGFSKPVEKGYYLTHIIVGLLCFCYMAGLLLFNEKVHILETFLFLALYCVWIFHDITSKHYAGEKYKPLWALVDIVSILVLLASLILILIHSAKSLDDSLRILLPDQINRPSFLKHIYPKDLTVSLALILWFLLKGIERFKYWQNYPFHYENYLRETRIINDSSSSEDKSLPFRLSDEIKNEIQQKLIDVNRTLKILDFGCGNGKRTKELVDALELTKKGVRVEIYFYDKVKKGWYKNWKKFVEKEWMLNLKENIQPQNIWKLWRSKKWYEMENLKLEWLPTRPSDLAEYDIVYASNVMYFPSVRKYIVSRFFEKKHTSNNEGSTRSRLLVVRGYNSSSFFSTLDWRQERKSAYNWMNFLQTELNKRGLQMIDIKKIEIKQQTGVSDVYDEKEKETLASAIAMIERDPLAEEFALQLLRTGDSNFLQNNETMMFIWNRGNQ